MADKKKIEKMDESVEEIIEVAEVTEPIVVPTTVVTKRNIHRIPARKNTFVQSYSRTSYPCSSLQLREIAMFHSVRQRSGCSPDPFFCNLFTTTPVFAQPTVSHAPPSVITHPPLPNAVLIADCKSILFICIYPSNVQLRRNGFCVVSFNDCQTSFQYFNIKSKFIRIKLTHHIMIPLRLK